MFRRGKIYYYRDPATGLKVSSKTSDKARAAQMERDALSDWHDRKTGRYVEKWEETCGRWMELNQHLANYYAQEDYRDFWAPHLTGMKITEIEETLVHRLMMSERKGRYAVNLKERVPANSTANNYVGFVSKMLRFGKVKAVPDFYRYPTVLQSKGALRPEQWAVWRDSMPADLRLLVTHTLATGFRIRNEIGFQWEWLHGQDDRAYLPATVTKTNQEYGVPFNRTASGVIAEIRRMPVCHHTHVFTHKGKTWKYATVLEAIKRTSKRALGFEVTPHWLRHTFRSWLAQEGVSDTVARRLGCWKLPQTADSKYLHFDVEPLRRFTTVLDPLLATTVRENGSAVPLCPKVVEKAL